jgi:hypothetical protein
VPGGERERRHVVRVGNGYRRERKRGGQPGEFTGPAGPSGPAYLAIGPAQLNQKTSIFFVKTPNNLNTNLNQFKNRT